MGGIQSTTTNPRVWHPAARLAFHASLVDPLGPEYLAPIPIDVCRRSVTEHDDAAHTRNDPTIMSPIYFETELDYEKRTDSRLVKVIATPTAQMRRHSPSDLLPTKLGTRIRCLLSNNLESSATLIPHHSTAQTVCARIDSSQVHVHLPRDLFNNRFSEL